MGKGSLVVSVGACLCGVGALVGLVFAGLTFQPEELEEGKCTATRPNTVECVNLNGAALEPNSKGAMGQIDNATFTGSDGLVKVCMKFRLSGKCPGAMFGGSTSDADLVLNGEVRDCYIGPDGLCVEPGVAGGGLATAIMLYILGALLCCVGACASILNCPESDDDQPLVQPESETKTRGFVEGSEEDEEEDDNEHEDSEEGTDEEGTHLC